MNHKIIKSDVLVIGSGGAGMRTAIELHKNKVDVLVVGKCKKRDAHTILATGGINAALGTMDPKDSWELHAADTIKDGGMINDPVAVQLLCKNAPAAVKELAKWGCPFHKEKNKKITQRFFGAATYRRACFVGDHTGKAILNTLVNQAVKRKIRFKSEVYIFSLLTDKKSNKVNGALGLDLNSGKILVFHSKLLVLATGGHSKMFKRSSSRFWENNGDGIALANDLGAKFMDMELFQFHPTGMVHPPHMDGVLVTEAVRGEGGILTNKKGERFMTKYDKARMELSARDVVARAIYHEVKAGRGNKHGAAFLDISHRSKSYILKRLPKMYNQFKSVGIDITKQKMEVAPTAHYSMGGLFLDHKKGTTTLPNVFAVGEVTSGVHGGNRLGGNSLAECVVFGKLTGQNIVKKLKQSSTKLLPLNNNLIAQKEQQLQSILSNKKGENPIKIKTDIQKMMWLHVGVERTEKLLTSALKKLEKFKKIPLKTGTKTKMNEKLIAALDIRNMLPTCEMIIKAAILRKESRCAHYRSDYLKTKKSWEKNILCQRTKAGSFKLTTKPIAKIPTKIMKHIKRHNAKNHLLE